MSDVVHRLVEAALWFIVLLAAYGQRDAYRDGNWPMFLVASGAGVTFAIHLRKHIQSAAVAAIRALEGDA